MCYPIGFYKSEIDMWPVFFLLSMTKMQTSGNQQIERSATWRYYI